MAKRRNSNNLSSQRRQGGRRGLWFLVFLCLTLGAVVFALLQKTTADKRKPTSGPSGHGRASTADERKLFASYGGSASCQRCHEEEFKLWASSHHGLAERPVSAERDLKAFEPARNFGQGLQAARVGWTNDTAWLTCIGLSGQAEAHSAVRMLGEDPLRQVLIAFPGGRLQASEAAYDPRRNEWFDVFGEEQRHPGEWGHWTGRGMNWNFMCASCHNTALRRHYDESSDSYHTTMVESGVGCESCHGPLAAHNEWQTRFGKSGGKDPIIPKFTKEQVVDNCGSCHARRTELAEGMMPGDKFLDFYEPVIVDQTERYFADGQVHEEDYEYGSFLGSRMHQRGVTCQDCHNPHSMKTVLPGNWLCLRCHGGGDTNAPLINPVAHSRHKVFGFGTNGQPLNVDLMAYKPGEVKETGGECVNCHMPQTVYMQRHWRHDHGFTCPDPLLTKEFGIPNACNRCHQDKDATWALKWCEQWYGPKMDRVTRRRAEVIARAQRGELSSSTDLTALFGNEEVPYWRAVELGLLSSWSSQAPVLAFIQQSLNDTNALVRTVAAKTLETAVAGGELRSVEALRRGLSDPVRSVRVAAALSLGSRLPPGQENELLVYLEDQADEPAGQMQKAIYYFGKNELAAALKHAQTAVSWEPNAAPLRQELAVILGALSRPQEAAEQLREACRLAPQDSEGHYKLALALNELGDLSGAAAELAKAVELQPRHVDAWYNLGLAQSALGQPEQALDSLGRAEALAPEVARIPYARATVLARLQRISEAKAAVRRALQLDPSLAQAQELLRSLGE